MKSFKSPKVEAETFLVLDETRSTRRSGGQTLHAAKMILNLGTCLFLPSWRRYKRRSTNGLLKPYSTLSLRITQLLFVIGAPIFLYKGIRITAGAIGRNLSGLR